MGINKLMRNQINKSLKLPENNLMKAGDHDRKCSLRYTDKEELF